VYLPIIYGLIGTHVYVSCVMYFILSADIGRINKHLFVHHDPFYNYKIKLGVMMLYSPKKPKFLRPIISCMLRVTLS
jgi:hypothetical protein